MRILAIDSATTPANVALLEDSSLIGEQVWQNTEAQNGAPFHSEQKRAEILLPLINSLLANHRLTLGDLSALAVSIGPGSFTGLRIGLATAKGIAYAGKLPVIGISTLHAIAARVKNFDAIICSLLDARKKEVYLGLFQRNGEALSRLTNDTLTSIDAAIGVMQKYYSESCNAALMVIGDGVKAYEKLLTNAFNKQILLQSGDGYPSVASEVALLARSRFMKNSFDDLGSLVPAYLRRPEAEARKLNLSH